jgi:hypothetical protein
LWQKGLTNSQDDSTAMGVYAQAANFLFENLGQNETALVPMSNVFSTLNPELSGRLITYESMWNSAGVILQASTNITDILKVRSYIVNFLNQNLQVKFIVRDWVDAYATPLFDSSINYGLSPLFKEVQVFPFMLSTGWSSQITIYERVQVAQSFEMNLSLVPKNYFTAPSNTSVIFSSHGAVVQKTGPSANLYFPLPESLNVSKYSYITLQVKPDVPELNLTIVFYYDTTGTGVFSGYGADFVRSMLLNQVQEGWNEGKSNEFALAIPISDYPVVQIGLCLSGNCEGTITFSNLNVYMEIT